MRYGRALGFLHGHNWRSSIHNQRGERNPRWRGDAASYSAFHLRVAAERGQPARCEVCKTTDPHRPYDWANLTGNYADVMDYKRMCRSCHWKFDEKIENIRGARATVNQNPRENSR